MKIKSIILSLALLTSLILGITACNLERTYYGEYIETAGSNEYKTKVYVITKGDIITKVQFAEGSTHHTDLNYWPDGIVWKNAEEEVLASFVGKSVKEIKNSTTNEVYDAVVGATLTSNRVYQAIKNAVSK